jgi:hypothetical protein
LPSACEGKPVRSRRLQLHFSSGATEKKKVPIIQDHRGGRHFCVINPHPCLHRELGTQPRIQREGLARIADLESSLLVSINMSGLGMHEVDGPAFAHDLE